MNCGRSSSPKIRICSRHNLSRVAQMLAEKGTRVNAVAPGPIWTPLIPSTLPDEAVKNGRLRRVDGSAKTVSPSKSPRRIGVLYRGRTTFSQGSIYRLALPAPRSGLHPSGSLPAIPQHLARMRLLPRPLRQSRQSSRRSNQAAPPMREIGLRPSRSPQASSWR